MSESGSRWTYVLASRVSASEHIAAQAAARAEGLSLSLWARRAIADALGRARPPIPRRVRYDDQALLALAGRVSQAAGLLQILRLEARAGRVDGAAVERAAVAIEALVDPVRSALRSADAGGGEQ